MAGARQIVEPPTFTPTPYGLLTTVQMPTPDGPHWQNGIEYQPVCADPASTYDECIAVTGAGSAPPPQYQGNTVYLPLRAATPFTVQVEFQCSTVGNNDATKVAKTAMAGQETWQVERTFWTGVAGNTAGGPGGRVVAFPHLAANAQINDTQAIGGIQQVMLQSAAVIVSGVGDTTTNLATQLGLLEQALADCYNGIGVIHVPQILAPTLGGLIKPNGPQMYTANGNLVAIGAGYPGTSPAGAPRDADKTWIYATGAVMAYRSDIRVRASENQSVNKSTNTRTMIAERTYLLGWDCCHFAIEVSLGAPKGN